MIGTDYMVDAPDLYVAADEVDPGSDQEALVRRRERRGLHALPHGPHGLTRERVATNHRARIFDALADCLCREVMADVTVAKITKHAGLSRRAFYELFTNKWDCFEQAAGEP